MCEVIDCLAGTTDCKEKREFFAIPKISDTASRRHWLERINRLDFNPNPDQDYYVCDRHFDDTDFEHTIKGTISLRAFAVPKYHMTSGKDTEIPEKLDRNVRQKRARENQDAKRFKLERFEKMRKFPDSWYNYSKLLLLPWNCQLNRENARVLDILISEAPRRCLGKRRVTCTNEIKMWNGEIQIEIFHCIRSGGKKEKLVVQKADLSDSCLVWRQEVQPPIGNDDEDPFQHVDIAEDPLAITNSGQPCVKTEVFDIEDEAESILDIPNASMKVENSDIKQEHLEITDTTEVMDNELNVYFNEEIDTIKQEMGDFDT